ncbi:MAG: hypothetical protein MZV65_33060 [Chromatiales bacterium]|nr:hypothetical protein [Chromatiales bacterium]
MSIQPTATEAKPLTFRRYKDGDDKPLRLAAGDLRRRPLAQVPDLHPEHAALPGLAARRARTSAAT